MAGNNRDIADSTANELHDAGPSNHQRSVIWDQASARRWNHSPRRLSPSRNRLPKPSPLPWSSQRPPSRNRLPCAIVKPDLGPDPDAETIDALQKELLRGARESSRRSKNASAIMEEAAEPRKAGKAIDKLNNQAELVRTLKASVGNWQSKHADAVREIKALKRRCKALELANSRQSVWALANSRRLATRPRSYGGPLDRAHNILYAAPPWAKTKRPEAIPPPANFSLGFRLQRSEPTAQPRLNPVLLNESNPHRHRIARANLRPNLGPEALAQSGRGFASRGSSAHANPHPVTEFPSTNKKSRGRYARPVTRPLGAIEPNTKSRGRCGPRRNSGLWSKPDPRGLLPRRHSIPVLIQVRMRLLGKAVRAAHEGD